MDVELHYGDGVVTLKIPERNLVEVIRPWDERGEVDNEAIMRGVMDSPQRAAFMQEAAGKKVCVLLSDATRDMPFRDVFAGLFGILSGCSSVQFLICTGTHEAETAGNRRIMGEIEGAAGKAGVKNFAVDAHDCQADELIEAGRIVGGTEVLFNAKAADADIFLVLSDVKCHYFAGYSNPVKNFLPGICGYVTAEQNHSLSLDEKSTYGLHPWHADEKRRGNPVSIDQVEGMRMIVKERAVYSLVTISSSGKIQWARFGDVEEVSREAFSITDQRNTYTVRPADRLIVSPGGLPNDIDLYIAQRALETTKAGVKDGGEVLFVAACPKGVGEKQTLENFYNRLTAPVETVIKTIEAEYKLFSHKAYKLARMIQHLNKIWMYSVISDELIEAMHFFPADGPQRVVDNWLAEDDDVTLTVVDGANKIALYSADEV
jgi:nickel-dependent lactate racemase